MNCPRCQQENPPQAKFCLECGTPTRAAAGDARAYADLKDDNDRLRQSLSEALEQQAATAEILSAISCSPTDVRPVFETILERAAKLCEAELASLWLYEGGGWFRVGAAYGGRPDYLQLLKQEPHRFEPPFFREGGPWRVGQILDVRDTEPYRRGDPFWVRTADHEGMRTLLGVPLVKDGRLVGSISVYRREVRQFTGAQVALVKTFADQAVIAIENVRLFNETTEALEQQRATAEILRVISTSPTDLQPVFDAIVGTGAHLCGADYGFLARYDGMSMAIVAQSGARNEEIETVLRVYPMAPTPDSLGGRTILERAVIHLPDVRSDPTYGPRVIQDAGWRTGLGVPLLREGAAIGLVGMWRRDVRPFSDRQIELLKVFADQAVIAIENVRLFKDLEARNRDLGEALAQQTATSEVLKLISRSAFDLQPVLESLVENAVRLCGADKGLIYRQDADLYRIAVSYGHSSDFLEVAKRYPIRQDRTSATGRAVLERRVVHIHDILADPEYTWAADLRAREEMHRTILAVPMLREGAVIGVIVIRRTQVRPFTDQQIDLVATFADQAAIAIENARLLAELQAKNASLTEALEQQTATAEILRVISSSPTDLQPVFETVVENAVRLCEAERAFIFRYDGDVLRVAATYNVSPARRDFAKRHPIRPGRHSAGARAALERRTIHIHDIQADPEYTYQVGQSDPAPTRTVLSVPMLRADELLGVITIFRHEVRPFTAQQVDLVQTFANQAVIAIENVRLFTELQEKNRALTAAHAEVTETLEQQTAMAEILRVISGSRTDLQLVFDTILQSAVRLCGALNGFIWRVENGLRRQVSYAGVSSPEWEAIARGTQAGPPTLESVSGWVQIQREVLHVRDLEQEDRFPRSRQMARAMGYRSLLAVPLLRHQDAVGAIVLNKTEPFDDGQIQLLRTFADQAVIAIENGRLLSELQARTAELTRSVDELTALGEVGRALSSTLNLEDVLQTIVTRATQLTETAGCVIWEYDKPREEFRLRVSHYTHDSDAAILPARGGVTAIPRGQGLTTQVMEERHPMQISDITLEGAYESPVRQPLIDAGHRALLGVPLMSEDQVIGVLAVTRKTPGEFEPEVIRLLSTFANQSVLAIQNARLFREIADKSRQLEIASQHKSEFLANMSHELRTPLNAIIGFSEVLSERMFGDLNEKQEEYLKDIHASGQHLLSLINDILDLSKIEAGRMELELTEFDLRSAIDNALTLVRERASRHGIALHHEIDPRFGQIRGDERKLKQVLLNLLSNAIKFTPEGGRIDVRAALVHGVAEVAVADTGVGITLEDQEAVFEEFRQVGTADKKVEGTGLGLTLSRKFIELHGGRIWVQSQVGVGSTFTFTIPVRRVD